MARKTLLTLCSGAAFGFSSKINFRFKNNYKEYATIVFMLWRKNVACQQAISHWSQPQQHTLREFRMEKSRTLALDS